MISAVCALLLVIAWLSREPSEHKNLRRMKRERYDLNPLLRKKT